MKLICFMRTDNRCVYLCALASLAFTCSTVRCAICAVCCVVSAVCSVMCADYCVMYADGCVMYALCCIICAVCSAMCDVCCIVHRCRGTGLAYWSQPSAAVAVRKTR